VGDALEAFDPENGTWALELLDDMPILGTAKGKSSEEVRCRTGRLMCPIAAAVLDTLQGYDSERSLRAGYVHVCTEHVDRSEVGCQLRPRSRKRSLTWVRVVGPASTKPHCNEQEKEDVIVDQTQCQATVVAGVCISYSTLASSTATITRNGIDRSVVLASLVSTALEFTLIACKSS
jgi:hypothetical protein